MGIRSESRLERVLHDRSFAVTAEVVPPRGGGAGPVVAQSRALRGYADAVNVTDSPTSSAHMSPLAGAAFVAQQGLEPVMQITTRDRNRLALTGDLLGGWALGVRNVLCLTGDPVAAGDHPDAREVHDLSVVDLVRFVVKLRDEGTLLSGAPVQLPPRYFVGVADVPLAGGYDPARLEEKAEAGADFVQTQIVYDVDAIGAWAEQIRGRGIFDRVFVLVGVAPPRSAAAARYVRDHLPGVGVPDALLGRLEQAGDGAEDEGVRLTVEIIDRLRTIPGIAGVHVMGLGHEEAVRRVIEAAGLLPRPEPSTAEASGFAPTRVHAQPGQVQPQPAELPEEARPAELAPAKERPAEQPAPAGAPEWAPTHVVPAGGMVAWQAPHPSAPQTAQLQPGLPIQVVERLGAWARVVASNGWWGWVDGRMLP